MSYVIKHRSGSTIPTNKENKDKEFDSKKEAKAYIADYGLGGEVISNE